MSVITDSTAIAAAHDWLRRHDDRVDYTVEREEGDAAVWHVATAVARLDVDGEDVEIRRRLSAERPEGALELVRLELLGALARLHAHPEALHAYASAYRDMRLHRQDEHGNERVQRAVTARGGQRPTPFQINAARIRLGAGAYLTVGQVADEITRGLQGALL